MSAIPAPLLLAVAVVAALTPLAAAPRNLTAPSPATKPAAWSVVGGPWVATRGQHVPPGAYTAPGGLVMNNLAVYLGAATPAAGWNASFDFHCTPSTAPPLPAEAVTETSLGESVLQAEGQSSAV